MPGQLFTALAFTALAFTALREQLYADEDVLGVFLSGSRGKGFYTASSDYDVYIVTRDDAVNRAKQRYPFRYGADIDCIVVSLTEFRAYAEWDGGSHWDRYSFAHVNVLFERAGGTIQKLIEQKGKVPAEHRLELLRNALDACLNATYRSFRCRKRGDELGAKLEAAVSLPFLLEFLFALEGRHAPFAGYLERELQTYPLRALPLSTTKLLSYVGRALNADVEAQKRLLGYVDGLGHVEGLGDVFTGWGKAYPWMLTFSP